MRSSPARRARAGVKVHLRLDWLGSQRIEQAMITEMKDAGIEIERYHPHYWEKASGRVLQGGAEIYEYQPAMFHGKAMIVDSQQVSVGSTNFDNRSFRLDEMIVIVVLQDQQLLILRSPHPFGGARSSTRAARVRCRTNGRESAQARSRHRVRRPKAVRQRLGVAHA